MTRAKVKVKAALTTVPIDEKLVRRALRATGLETAREVAELGLRTLLRLEGQQVLRELKGRVHFEADMR